MRIFCWSSCFWYWFTYDFSAYSIGDNSVVAEKRKTNKHFFQIFLIYIDQKKLPEERSSFSLLHITDSFQVTFKKRQGPNRKFILLFFLLLTFCESLYDGENSTAYFYVRTRYGWEQTEYSNYLSITTISSVAGKQTGSGY